MQRAFISLFILIIGILGSQTKSLSATAPAASPSKTIFSPGLAFPIAADTGETGGGFSFGLLSPVDSGSRLFAGADVGLHFWGKAVSLTESTTAAQLAPTVVYLLSSRPNWIPFVGASAGAYWYVAQAAGATGIDFILLFRPGVLMTLSPSMSLSVEAKYGTLGGLFLFMPTIGVNIAL